jgi:hypothetical protein
MLSTVAERFIWLAGLVNISVVSDSQRDVRLGKKWQQSFDRSRMRDVVRVEDERQFATRQFQRFRQSGGCTTVRRTPYGDPSESTLASRQLLFDTSERSV